MAETFVDIKGYEGLYQIGDNGSVKSFHKNKIIIKKPGATGYKRDYLGIALIKNGKKQSFKIHRLVAEHFVPNYHNKGFINHIDGNKFNNNASNLEWCTRNENMQHAYDHGLKKPMFGSDNGRAILSKEDIRLIRQRLLNGEKQSEIAREFNVSKCTISAVCTGRNWGWVA